MDLKNVELQPQETANLNITVSLDTTAYGHIKCSRGEMQLETRAIPAPHKKYLGVLRLHMGRHSAKLELPWENPVAQIFGAMVSPKYLGKGE